MIVAADPPVARIVMRLDELVAVYHKPSGTTHLLASPASEMLEALAEGPADARTLLHRLARSFELADADLEVIGARMLELIAVGLAWRI